MNQGPENLRARDEEDGLSVHHSQDLFDENEDRAGEKTDLATGKPIDNSTETDVSKLSEVTPGEHDALPELPKEMDDAERWLAENDPERKAA